MHIFVEILGFIAGLFTTFSGIPQMFKIVKTKDVSALSLTSLVIVDFGSALWLFYAFLIRDDVLVGWQVVAIILNSTMIVLKLKYNTPCSKKCTSPQTEMYTLVIPQRSQNTTDDQNMQFYNTRNLILRTSSSLPRPNDIEQV
jgi:MtN3 and saliva related transmembrane protein